ncbi:MAG TPA: hypothetical protein ENK97_01140 [Campylobacteraceae bacterium]|nr:hypothetical protein [Campylobacteraceae bacterium]
MHVTQHIPRISSAAHPKNRYSRFSSCINRGVEQRNVFLDAEDFDTFLSMLCEACLEFGVKVHAYALMSNHHHLLIETSNENLSMFMRRLNSIYAIYFNRKYTRSGHLWQGRFKSRYVADEHYLYTLIRYIEYNPLKAGLIEKIGTYPYSSAYFFLDHHPNVIPCIGDSVMSNDFATVEARMAFFQSGIDERILDKMQKSSKLVVMNEKPKTDNLEQLKKLFKRSDTKPQRNVKILEAYQAGISQHKIATFLQLSQPTVNAIIKREKRKGDDTDN